MKSEKKKKSGNGYGKLEEGRGTARERVFFAALLAYHHCGE